MALTAGPVDTARASLAGRRVALHSIALPLIAAAAGLSYAWALNDVVLEPYYAAAVRTMAASWRHFAFGAFDPAATITVDKLPGALWVQALSVRIFGWHTWSLVLPQVIEGIAAVLVLYRAVRPLAGPGAATIAALVLAVSPALVGHERLAPPPPPGGGRGRRSR